jgi:hypothetical protein
MAIVLGLVVPSLWAGGVGKVSDANQKKIDKIKKLAASNNWAGVKATYSEINLLEGDAVEDLKAVAKEIPKHKETQELRREIKTRYLLLREDTNDLPELADVDAYEVKLVQWKPLVVDYVPLDFLQVTDAEVEQAMSDWSRRWNVAIDAVGTDGIRVIPHPASALGVQRAALMQAIAKNGWTPETEAAWAAYWRALSGALNRRIGLSGRNTKRRYYK